MGLQSLAIMCGMVSACNVCESALDVGTPAFEGLGRIGSWQAIHHIMYAVTSLHSLHTSTNLDYNRHEVTLSPSIFRFAD